jgi:hypothetical protein
MRRLPPKYDPKPTQSEGETSDPLIADHRNFYKVEKWMKDGSKVDHMLYAGSDLEKARYVFAAAIKHRPREYPNLKRGLPKGIGAGRHASRATRARCSKRANCWHRFTAGSPRGSTRAI